MMQKITFVDKLLCCIASLSLTIIIGCLSILIYDDAGLEVRYVSNKKNYSDIKYNKTDIKRNITEISGLDS